MKKKELHLTLAVPQPCWTKHWLLQVWACRDEDWHRSHTRLSHIGHASMGPLPWPHGFLQTGAWSVTLALVDLPTAVFAFLTVNLGRSEEGTEGWWCCLKTPPPPLRLNEEANYSGLNLPLFNICSVFPKFIDAELHLLRGFITLKEKRYCITISIRFQLTQYCLFCNMILRRIGGNCSELGNYMVCFKRTKGFRLEWMH